MQHNIYTYNKYIYSLGYSQADFHVVSHVPSQVHEEDVRKSGVGGLEINFKPTIIHA